MKNTKFNFILMLVALGCALNSTKIDAQNFTAANVTDNGVLISSTRKIGSDILDNSSNTYRVCTWADGSGKARLEWRVNYSGSLYVSGLYFTNKTAVVTQDVCLVVGGSDIYALAVYYQGSTFKKIFYELFKWNTTTHVFVSQSCTTLSTNENSNNATNIDADENGNFIMVWDDNGTIYGQYGIISSSVPALSGSVTSMTTGVSPDVSLYDPSDMYLAYINSGLVVDKFSSGSLSTLTNKLSAAGSVFPRISSPNQHNGNADDWAVVTEDVVVISSVNHYQITAYISVGGTVSSAIVCNDGTLITSGGIDLAPNFEPVITYDSQSSAKIWVAWTFDNSTPTYSTGTSYQAVYPVSVHFNTSGSVGGITAYWNVPTPVAANNAKICPSLAGRHSSATSNQEKLFVAYLNDVNDNLVMKNNVITSTATSLRTANNSTSFNETIKGMQNLFQPSYSGMFSFRLFDLSGRIILSANADLDRLKELFFEESKNLNRAVYFAELISEDKAVKRNGKIFIAE